MEVGCNSVLNPGTVLWAAKVKSTPQPGRGVIPTRGIYKDSDTIVSKL